MSRFVELRAYGLSIFLPAGWDGEIFQRDLDGDPTNAVTSFKPVLHVANFPLPAGRGDFGSIAVESMGSGAILLAVLEYDEMDAGTALFDHPLVNSMTTDEFGPNNLQRPLPGQAGAQRFFHVGNRAFCLYCVLGNYNLRNVLVPELNQVLGTLTID